MACHLFTLTVFLSSPLTDLVLLLSYSTSQSSSSTPIGLSEYVHYCLCKNYFFFFSSKHIEFNTLLQRTCLQQKIIIALVIEAIFMAILIFVTLTFLHGTKDRSMLIGIVAIVFNIIMYTSPLTVMVSYIYQFSQIFL